MFYRGGLDGSDVRTVVMLGKCTTGEALALGHLGKPFYLLIFCAETQDDLGGEIGNEKTGADRAVTPRQFLSYQNVF
jgi:hypothetical protein